MGGPEKGLSGLGETWPSILSQFKPALELDELGLNHGFAT